MILLNLLKQEDELTKRKEKIKLSLDAYDSTNRTKNTKRNSQNPNILIKRFDLIHKNLIVLSSLCYNNYLKGVMQMRGVVTVIGKDKVGIVAGTSQKLAELKINILDVSQTIMGDYFTMMMLVDLTNATADFEGAREQLHELGKNLGVKISIQNQEIFDTMHKL